MSIIPFVKYPKGTVSHTRRYVINLRASRKHEKGLINKDVEYNRYVVWRLYRHVPGNSPVDVAYIFYRGNVSVIPFCDLAGFFAKSWFVYCSAPLDDSVPWMGATDADVTLNRRDLYLQMVSMLQSAIYHHLSKRETLYHVNMLDCMSNWMVNYWTKRFDQMSAVRTTLTNLVCHVDAVADELFGRLPVGSMLIGALQAHDYQITQECVQEANVLLGLGQRVIKITEVLFRKVSVDMSFKQFQKETAWVIANTDHMLAHPDGIIFVMQRNWDSSDAQALANVFHVVQDTDIDYLNQCIWRYKFNDQSLFRRLTVHISRVPVLLLC